VTDTVGGFLAALKSARCEGEVINLGSNFEISIGDTARQIAQLMGAQVQFDSDEQRVRPEKSEVERLWSDNRKARELLGWEPAFAGLEGFRRGLQETIRWFGEPEHLGLYRSDTYNL
jgi:dTDP-glucose 4,6-dehydratase